MMYDYGFGTGKLTSTDDIYKKARSEGCSEVLKRKIKRVDPYLPTLEDKIEDINYSISKFPVYEGFISPDSITGTFGIGRKFCFSNSFLPLPKLSQGDFSAKWINLYQNVCKWLESPNRVELYEFMHNYYVKEGHKRTSVARYKELGIINVSIARIIPEYDSKSKDVVAYHDFLNFEKQTGISSVWFNDSSRFEELDDFINKKLPESENPYKDFVNMVYAPFLRNFKHLKEKDLHFFEVGDIFMDFINLYDDPSLYDDKNIKKRIRNIIFEHKKNNK